MRILLVPGLLALALSAGCIDGTGPESGQDTDDQGRGPAPAVDGAAVVAELQRFAADYPVRAGNRPDHEAARQYLLERFASFGLETYRFDYDTGNLAGQADILGIKWGAVRDEWIVVGGHYDIVSCPNLLPVSAPTPEVDGRCATPGPTQSTGIYDDGSGTIMTVHLAEAFADVETHYTMVFVGFDGEELGLEGSGAFAEAFPAGATPYGEVTIHAMLDLDMFGLNCPGVDAPIYFDSNSPQLDGEVARLAGELGFPCEVKYQGISLGRSDYAHFFALNVPTGFFISSFEEYQAPADAPAAGQQPVPGLDAYPFWHQFDTWDTMVLMAGSEEDVVSGFQAGVDLAAGVLWFMDDPAVVYEVETEE